MSSRKVPLTFTFHRAGVQPPLFVAGTFSDPPWQPLVMDASTDQHGDFIFSKEVMVDECSEIQYKFRHAFGDWWALDPHADTGKLFFFRPMSITDTSGNVNSLLYSPRQHSTQDPTPVQENHAAKPQDTTASHVLGFPDNTEEAATPTDNRDAETATPDLLSPKGVAEKLGLRRLSPTPIKENANLTTEIPDSASQLDDDDLDAYSNDILPMLSHECFGSAPCGLATCDKGSWPEREDPNDSSENAGASDTNYDDPALEPFPSDRESIIATMRRLSASLEADPTMIDLVPLSSITEPRPSAADPGISSPTPGLFGVEDKPAMRKTADDVKRQSATNLARTRSLHSIAEGEEAPKGFYRALDRAEEPGTPVQQINPIEARKVSLASIQSNDDEGISMRSGPFKRASGIEPSSHEVFPKTTVNEPATNSSRSTKDSTSSSTLSSSKWSSELDDTQSGVYEPTHGERPLSPSVNPPVREGYRGSWFWNLLHMIFVDCFRGLWRWLCGRG
ncbi:hypothetical protein F4777DRAFT_574382 [Nemania sp. FL0916]|nr:hypothetical protein F4777DRAFT_574382 [Nemania sp. FL0916]